MNVLFIMDEPENIHPEKDTTDLLIRETLRRKFKPYYCDQSHLTFRQGELFTHCQSIEKWQTQKGSSSDRVDVLFGKLEGRSIASFQVVFMRKDPPFNTEYLTSCYLLDLASSKTLILNCPRNLILSNEKIYTFYFSGLFPETIITRERAEIERFVNEVGGMAVLKPLYRCGGEGVFLLKKEDPNLYSIIENSLLHFPEGVVVQRYLPEVKKGDKRIILLDGDPVGAIIRRSPTLDIRSNIHVGGECFKTQLTDREKEICRQLKPKLIEDGLFLVGLDVIGDYLSEINVTSPTGFQEINRLNELKGDQTMEALTFDRVEEKVSSFQKKN